MQIEGSWNEKDNAYKDKEYISFELPYSETVRKSLHKYGLIPDYGPDNLHEERDALLIAGSPDISVFVCIEVNDTGWKPVATIDVLHTKDDFAIDYPDYSSDKYCKNEVFDSLAKAISDKYPDRTPMEIEVEGKGHRVDMETYKELLVKGYSSDTYGIAFRQSQIIFDIVHDLYVKEQEKDDYER